MHAITYSGGNDVALLRSGAEFFPALIAAIDEARAEIYLETYIFRIDSIGILVRDALCRAAARGVSVSVISDWLGTGRVQSRQLKKTLTAAAIAYRSFNPWFRRGVARDHRKLCVVDRKYAFVGGLNIVDDFINDVSHIALPAPRWDFAVRIEGPLVQVIHQEMQNQWIRIGKMKLRARWESFRQMRATTHATQQQEPVLAGLVVRDNLRNRRTIQRATMQALGQARDVAFLVSPYFAPGRKLCHALEEAAGRGVRVTLLLGIGQFYLQDAVAHSYYSRLLEAGVRIVEYTRTELHAKVAVIDDTWATVGSSNYDGLSLFVNQEANVLINDVDFASKLRAEIEAGISNGRLVRLQDVLHAPRYRQFWYGVVSLLYRGIIHVITLGRDA